MRAAIGHLMRAHQYAASLEVDPWDFAVEIASLYEVGLSNNELRWLLFSELIVHGAEVTTACDQHRRFHAAGKFIFNDQSCFTLTTKGMEVAQAIADNEAAQVKLPTRNRATSCSGAIGAPMAGVTRAGRLAAEISSGAVFPKWEKERRILRVGGQVVKQFKVPAPNQEMILTVFEEEHWPPRIDDPLPSHPEMDAKRRLHDTINSLNRNQRCRLLRFVGDGSGEAVCWETMGLLRQPVPH
jgi:hypothetical protein